MAKTLEELAGPIQIWHCRCTAWPIAIWAKVGRCGECGERPKPPTN